MKRKDKGRLVDIEMILTPNLTEPESDLASRAREALGTAPEMWYGGKIKGLDDQPNGLREQTPPRSAAR
jgi:hypothetical protein